MKKTLFSLLLFSLSILMLSAKSYTVTSPDGRLTLTIDVGDKVTYTVKAGDATLVAPSAIALELEDGTLLGNKPKVSSVNRDSSSEHWPML